MNTALLFQDYGEFWRLWEQFVKANLLSYTYSKRMHEYYLLYARDSIKDLSFLLVDSENGVDNVVALCPLFMEPENGRLCFSYCGGPIHSWVIHQSYLGTSKYKKIKKDALEGIFDLAEQNNVKKMHFYCNPLDSDDNISPLLFEEAYDYSKYTCIIRLDKDKTALWKDVRKGHKAAIKQGEKQYEVHIMDYKNSSYEIYEEYRKTHHRCAGRVTRSKETFDKNYEMIQNDEGILVFSKKADKYIAFNLFLHSNKRVYYASACNELDLKLNEPFGHVLVWKAIEYYQKRGFEKIEIGQQFPALSPFVSVTEKEKRIAFYKRGFGGELKTVFHSLYVSAEEIKMNTFNH